MINSMNQSPVAMSNYDWNVFNITQSVIPQLESIEIDMPELDTFMAALSKALFKFGER